MAVNIIGKTKDLRTQTHVIYAQMPIPEYLLLVGENFDDFAIQRNRQQHRTYGRMKKDIIEGTVLPSITLAVKPDFIEEIIPLIADDQLEELALVLSSPGRVNILDGLQRTFILKDLESEGVEFKKNQKLLLEFWIEEDVKHLIYRLIVLNAGQKPMSMRHQVELLFSTLKGRLEKDIEGLIIYVERDGARRSMPKKYPLDRLATAYISFLTKSPEIKRENIIAQQLIEDEILDSDEESLNEKFEGFKEYLKIYSQLDLEIFRIYSDDGNKNWLAGENVLNSFFAAIADFGSVESRKKRIESALLTLLNTVRESDAGDDPLGLSTFKKIVDGFNPRKVNIGFSTRKLLTNGFKEFFRDEGERTLNDYWLMEAE